MKYVIYKPINNTLGEVLNVIHNVTPEQYTKYGVLTDSAIPDMQQVPFGMIASLMINLTDNSLYMDYNRVESLDVTLKTVQNQLESVSKALEEIILGGF